MTTAAQMAAAVDSGPVCCCGGVGSSMIGESDADALAGASTAGRFHLTMECAGRPPTCSLPDEPCSSWLDMLCSTRACRALLLVVSVPPLLHMICDDPATYMYCNLPKQFPSRPSPPSAASRSPPRLSRVVAPIAGRRRVAHADRRQEDRQRGELHRHRHLRQEVQDAQPHPQRDLEEGAQGGQEAQAAQGEPRRGQQRRQRQWPRRGGPAGPTNADPACRLSRFAWPRRPLCQFCRRRQLRVRPEDPRASGDCAAPPPRACVLATRPRRRDPPATRRDLPRPAATRRDPPRPRSLVATRAASWRQAVIATAAQSPRPAHARTTRRWSR